MPVAGGTGQPHRPALHHVGPPGPASSITVNVLAGPTLVQLPGHDGGAADLELALNEHTADVAEAARVHRCQCSIKAPVLWRGLESSR
jgi:hypothetical protein